MTECVKGLTVALSQDIREDDCQAIIDAISMIKGVAGVEKHVADLTDFMARKQVKEELRSKMLNWFKDL